MGRANYDLPDDTILEVAKYAKAKSKKEAITIALDEYLRKKQAEEIIAAYGKMPLTWTQKTLKKHRD